eukprot:COSAG02_NODE_3453_length_6714_cov_65.566591_1_plen_78_part_00
MQTTGILLLGVNLSGVMGAHHMANLEAENTALKTQLKQLQQQLRQQGIGDHGWAHPTMEDIAESKPNIMIIFGDVRP